MAEHQVGTLVALDDEGRPTGIVTDRDIAIRCVAAGLDLEATPVARIFTSPIQTAREETAIDEALSGNGRSGRAQDRRDR